MLSQNTLVYGLTSWLWQTTFHVCTEYLEGVSSISTHYKILLAKILLKYEGYLEKKIPRKKHLDEYEEDPIEA